MVEKKSTKAKSTPKKRAVKKVEESKPESEPRQAEPVQPQINWDVIGFSSAAVTLVGAALLYMAGFSYINSWYDYFGVPTFRLNLPVDFIIMESRLPLITILLIFTPIAILLMEVNKRTALILGASLFILGAGLTIGGELTRSQIVSELGSLLSYIALMIVLGAFIREENFWKLERRIVIATILIAIMLLVGLISFIGIFLGHFAARTGLDPFSTSQELRTFPLVSSEPIPSLEDALVDSAQDIDYAFSYGPFTIVAENDYSIYLIRQPGDTEKYSTEKPELFIVPRNSNYDIFFIPARQLISNKLNLTPTLTTTQTPIVKTTIAPSLTVTATVDKP